MVHRVGLYFALSSIHTIHIQPYIQAQAVAFKIQNAGLPALSTRDMMLMTCCTISPPSIVGEPLILATSSIHVHVLSVVCDQYIVPLINGLGESCLLPGLDHLRHVQHSLSSLLEPVDLSVTILSSNALPGPSAAPPHDALGLQLSLALLSLWTLSNTGSLYSQSVLLSPPQPLRWALDAEWHQIFDAISLRKLDEISLAAQREDRVVPVAGNRVLVRLERARYRLNGLGCGCWSFGCCGGDGGLWEDCCWWVARKEARKTLWQRFRQLDVSGGGRHGEIAVFPWS